MKTISPKGLGKVSRVDRVPEPPHVEGVSTVASATPRNYGKQPAAPMMPMPNPNGKPQWPY